MALALERDVALSERGAVLLYGGIVVAHVSSADLKVFVFEHGLAVDDVPHALRAVHFDLDAHPLIASIALGGGVQAMGLDHFAIAVDLGARSADIQGGALAGRSGAEEL